MIIRLVGLISKVVEKLGDNPIMVAFVMGVELLLSTIALGLRSDISSKTFWDNWLIVHKFVGTLALVVIGLLFTLGLLLVIWEAASFKIRYYQAKAEAFREQRAKTSGK